MLLTVLLVDEFIVLFMLDEFTVPDPVLLTVLFIMDEFIVLFAVLLIVLFIVLVLLMVWLF